MISLVALSRRSLSLLSYRSLYSSLSPLSPPYLPLIHRPSLTSSQPLKPNPLTNAQYPITSKPTDSVPGCTSSPGRIEAARLRLWGGVVFCGEQVKNVLCCVVVWGTAAGLTSCRAELHALTRPPACITDRIERGALVRVGRFFGFSEFEAVFRGSGYLVSRARCGWDAYKVTTQHCWALCWSGQYRGVLIS